MAVIPTTEELAILTAEARPVLAAALAVIAETGLRVGGLPSLSIREEGRYWTISKGHRIVGSDPISKKTKKYIHAAGLAPRHPFSLASLSRIGWKLKDGSKTTSKEGLVIARLQMMMQRLCQRLVAEGKIQAVYSFHDLRHAFAEANAPKGLRWLQRRLGHAGIAVTEKYLRNTLAWIQRSYRTCLLTLQAALPPLPRGRAPPPLPQHSKWYLGTWLWRYPPLPSQRLSWKSARSLVYWIVVRYRASLK